MSKTKLGTCVVVFVLGTFVIALGCCLFGEWFRGFVMEVVQNTFFIFVTRSC